VNCKGREVKDWLVGLGWMIPRVGLETIEWPEASWLLYCVDWERMSLSCLITPCLFALGLRTVGLGLRWCVTNKDRVLHVISW
jgi:hypothetical protein